MEVAHYSIRPSRCCEDCCCRCPFRNRCTTDHGLGHEVFTDKLQRDTARLVWKEGKPWHITVAITKADNEEIETQTNIHLFDECTQNWFAVASMIEHTLATLKTLKPNLSQVYLRSDNAGCYHCAYLLLSLPSIADRTGVNITRYDFSEPQAKISAIVASPHSKATCDVS